MNWIIQIAVAALLLFQGWNNGVAAQDSDQDNTYDPESETYESLTDSTTDVPGNEIYAVPADITHEELPNIDEFMWSVLDSTVELIISFNRVPVRFTAYALQNPDRIVLDCFGTTSRVGMQNKNLPAPVIRTDLSLQNAGEVDLELQRLILFTSCAVKYHVDESPTRLRLILDWNTRIEEQKMRQSKLRKVFWGSFITGLGGVAAGGIAAVISINNKVKPTDQDQPAGIIPPPDIPTPDGE